MAPSLSDLRSVPLFYNIDDSFLEPLVQRFVRYEYNPGEILFRAGDKPEDLLLLTAGQVSLLQDQTVRFRLHPIALIGELGALTGLQRRTTAKVTEPSEVFGINAKDLLNFFQSNSDIALRFYQNLLEVVANKVRRDCRRIDEMRSNIISTQKSMKRMRDLLLESQDTPVSSPIHTTLERLIEQNRKWHYMVQPVKLLPAFVRFDDHTTAAVEGISDGWLSLQKPAVQSNVQQDPSSDSYLATIRTGDRISAVLVLPTAEIAISGTVDSMDDSTIVVALDLLIDEYAMKVEDYLTRLHLLEFIV